MTETQAAIYAATQAREIPCSPMADTETIQEVRRQLRQAVYKLYSLQFQGVIPKEQKNEVEAEINACYERSQELKEILRQRSLAEAVERDDYIGIVAAEDRSDDDIL